MPESEVAILIRSWSARGYQRRDTGRPSAFAMASWRPCFNRAADRSLHTSAFDKDAQNAYQISSMIQF